MRTLTKDGPARLRGLNRSRLAGAISVPGFPVLTLVVLTLAACTSTGRPSETWELGPFYKSPANPILQPRGASWEAKDVFNPAAWADGETVYMLYRAEDSTGIGRWNGTSRIGLARSADGIAFDREPDPVLTQSESWEMPGGCEDPRVTKIGDTFFMTYTAYDGSTARLALATSTDLSNWVKHGVVFPERGWTKSGAILAERIDGRYWMYFGDTNIWAAHSTDGLAWTAVEEPVLVPREGAFDSRLVEPGPAPIMTEDGILLLYNGADDDLVYSAGQALFDPADPTRLRARSTEPFLRPTEMLERSGQIPNVVFVEGLVRFQEQWLLYFGMGDSGIGVAMTED